MKLKMWIGNLDGSRQGLVIAATKKRAVEVVGTGRTDFDAYWHERSVDPSLEPEVLYTRPFAESLRAGTAAWYRGRCPL
jgi:hypothetical protein